jgi:hypothetical protein
MEDERRELTWNDLADFPSVPQRHVLKRVPSGEIATEIGADGIFLRFDCDCIDALPVCQAQCCALPGTVILPEELSEVNFPAAYDDELKVWVLERSSDGFCVCLDRRTRMCQIYEDRPQTCKAFHCTKGASQRGWKIPNSVYRQT